MSETRLGEWNLLCRHAGSRRLEHYLLESGGDRSAAAALYVWNADIAAAFLICLGHLEVALRNAIDRRLSARQVERGRQNHWIFDEARELGRDSGKNGRQHGYPYADVAVAIRRVKQNGVELEPDQVISELSFGFWHQLVSKGQMALWPDLAAAFPFMPGRQQQAVSDRVARLRILRNRIGDHHRIWSLDLDRALENLLILAGYLDPDLARWIAGQSRVPQLLRERPVCRGL